MDIGNYFGPLLSKREDAPGYGPGSVALPGISIAAAILAGIYRYVWIWENAHRDNAGIPRKLDNAFDDDLTDMKNPHLRHTFRSVNRDLCFLISSFFTWFIVPQWGGRCSTLSFQILRRRCVPSEQTATGKLNHSDR
jgi:hypothetical protein